MKVKDAIGTILSAEGTEVVTGFPFNQVFDGAASAGIRTIVARTERVAANIADGMARASSGRHVGVCLVQYGPGAENVYGAVAQAWADASPLLVITGGYDTTEQGIRPNFSAPATYGPITKWVGLVNRPDRVAEVFGQAFVQLRTGRPGPVVVEVPNDLMNAEVPGGRYTPVRLGRAGADPDLVRETVAALVKAKAPVIVAGQGVLYAEAWDELRAFAELVGAPVMTTLAGKSAFPEDYALALGTGGLSRPGMVDRFLAEADFVLGVGTGFTRSHYTVAPPAGKIIAQVTNDPADIRKSYPVAYGLVGDAKAVLGQLIEAARRKGVDGRRAKTVARNVAKARRAFMKAWGHRLASDAEPISPYRVIAALMRVVDRRKTVLTHDSGNPRDQTVPFYEALVPHGYIGWGKSTQLGTGLGLAMGAKLVKPEWLAVNIMGDAAFGMVGMDVETAVRERIPIMTVIFRNGVMGGYTGHHPVATQKYRIHRQTGNYADVARALGAKGERVERVADLEPALKRAIKATKAGTPALVEVVTREETEFPIG
ncbi:MAG: thiamine pyrophosphate-requiring protein [Alphaproteobacteria bacterium]